ncbi:hypothetical protein [Rhodococcus sp. LB1]|uniref:hypothetical protein n=1 Tax=Rhodococcus sp. LB1 TaxID=1807499 RepID=UPI000A63A311|nr:hypothetical protein [Rhodococcus sp. LB1]
MSPTLKTPIGDLLGIDLPSMQAEMINDLPGAAEVLDRLVEETVDALRVVGKTVEYN